MKIGRIIKRGLATVMTLVVALPLLLVSFLAIVGCSAISPTETTTQERVQAFPAQVASVEHPVTIYWDEHQTPYIYAHSDADLAYGMGMVTQHLRGAQLAIMKRAAYGRLGESLGPFASDIDHLLKLLNFPKAGAAAERALDPETRAWVEAYVKGLNDYQNNWQKAPPEFGLLGMEPEPWTVDNIMTIGRMASSDVTWLAYMNLLAAQESPEWDNIKDRMMQRDIGVGAAKPFDSKLAGLGVLKNMTKSGSNTVAIGASRSASGAPVIANDPHLGLGFPNFWMTIGIQSPSYHAVGFMVPGLPFLALGRNENIAWGGTNARTVSSWLVDVTDEDIQCNKEQLDARLWLTDSVEVCTTKYGPVISDHPMWQAPEGKRYALNWLGHQEGSDELSAFLRSNRAKNVEEFRQAFKGYAVSSQNLIAVDKEGGMVHVLAMASPQNLSSELVQTPKRNPAPFLDATKLPADYAKDDQLITSANNRPDFAPEWQRGFYSANSRADRLRELINTKPKWDVASLLAVQQDVYSDEAYKLAQGLGKLLQQSEETKEYGEELSAWDGFYKVDSTGAVAFEHYLAAVVPRLYRDKVTKEMPKAYENWEYLSGYLLEDIQAFADRDLLLSNSMYQAQRTRVKFDTWGEMHKLRAGHWLAAAPIVGNLFKEEEWAAPGSRDTVLKRAHGLEDSKHYAFYGAQSRHISDMADLDSNYFVLFGGSDGWIGSDNYADQASMMVEGKMIQVPLRLESVQQQSVYSTQLLPR